jgi:hypothetical protein
MKINSVRRRDQEDEDRKLSDQYAMFENFLEALRERDLPPNVVESVNRHVEEINAFSGSNKALRNLLEKTRLNILRMLAKEVNLVAKNHYRNTWLATGMAAFGLPLGAAFGASLGNMAFIGMGLPIGMSIGIAIGARMDAKAAREGRQLDL